LGISWKALPTHRVAVEEGMWRDEIEVLGEGLEKVKIPRFRFPALIEPDWRLPGFLRGVLKDGLTARPFVDEDKCDRCDQCLEACPPKALKRRDGKLFFDPRDCIRCFCCQEVCPSGAICIKEGWALKIVGRRT
jgi:NAD-dependent dihydropyrimidine dehydrogenase PreA subunit